MPRFMLQVELTLEAETREAAAQRLAQFMDQTHAARQALGLHAFTDWDNDEVVQEVDPDDVSHLLGTCVGCQNDVWSHEDHFEADEDSPFRPLGALVCSPCFNGL